MFACKLRALATALVIGTATIGAVGVFTTTTAEALTLRKQVAIPLGEARTAADSGNYAGANAKIREAEAVTGKTADETAGITQMKAYVASKSGDFKALGGAQGAQAKFSSDWQARRYSEVIGAEDELRKNNILNPLNQQVIAQAYYGMRNYAGCTRYLRQSFGNSGNEVVLGLMRSCAHEANDQKAETEILEQLVARTGASKYWGPLLQQSLRARGLRDPQTLDIYRLKQLTGNMTRPDEYMTLAGLSLAVGLPKDGQTAVQKGIDAKVLTGDRPNRMNKMASDRNAAAEASLPQTIAAANASPNGDALVKLGEYQTSTGKPADGIKSIQAGIAKGVADRNFAQVRLGLAYLGAKQKDQAVRAFGAVKGDPNWEMVGHLWSLYARQGGDLGSSNDAGPSDDRRGRPNRRQ